MSGSTTLRRRLDSPADWAALSAELQACVAAQLASLPERPGRYPAVVAVTLPAPAVSSFFVGDLDALSPRLPDHPTKQQACG